MIVTFMASPEPGNEVVISDSASIVQAFAFWNSPVDKLLIMELWKIGSVKCIVNGVAAARSRKLNKNDEIKFVPTHQRKREFVPTQLDKLLIMALLEAGKVMCVLNGGPDYEIKFVPTHQRKVEFVLNGG